MVRYESSEIFVSIRYDAKRSYELGIEIGQLKALFNGQERAFSLNEILRQHKSNKYNSYNTIQASSQKALANSLKKMALLLSKYGANFLKNDLFAYKRLSDQREKECNEYELKTKLSYIKSDAHIAWKQKDYKQIITLFEPVKDALSNTELKKLNYAYKLVKKLEHP